MNKNFLIVATRPNFVKAYPLAKIFEKKKIKYKIIYINQHKDDNLSKTFLQFFFKQNKIVKLNCNSKTRNELASNIYLKLNKLINAEKPKNIFVFGDVDSTLHSAICSKNLNKILIHVESGLRSFDNKMPEEINRIIVDKISDIKFYTELSAYKNLKKENIHKDSYFVGNTMIDTLKFAKTFKKNYVNHKKTNKKNIYVTLHRPSNVDSMLRLKSILNILNILSKKYVINFSIHPRTMKNIDKFQMRHLLQKLVKLQPQDYFQNLNYIKNADLVITDSGGMQEELAFLGKPFVILRKNTERPIVLKNKNCLLLYNIGNNFLNKINKIISVSINSKIKYWDGKASIRIFKILKRKNIL